MKLTENDIINILLEYYKVDGWTIDSYCLGQKHGNDIEATKENTKLIVEAKGARASDDSPTKVREYFSNGQIKSHFGKAIIKLLDEKYKNPNAKLVIAHPDDLYVKKSISHLIPFLHKLDIKHIWVSESGKVIED